jgi:heptosyltransferase-2
MLLAMRTDRYPADATVARRYLDAAGFNSGTAVPSLRLYPSQSRMQALPPIQTSDIQRPSLALIPFTRWINKRWPLMRFAEVGRYFQSKGWNIVIFGGPMDTSNAEYLRDSIGKNCISMATGQPLGDTVCHISRCSLALGNDTGLLHAARACGIKTGAIFGSTTRQFGFFPYGTPEFGVFEVPLWGRPCHAHGGDICLRGTRPCLMRVSAEMVISGLLEILHK